MRDKQGRLIPKLDMRDYYGLKSECHAASDGECDWSHCPQLRDGEPDKTGRHCPLDKDESV